VPVEESQYDGNRIARSGLDRRRFSLNAITSVFNYIVVIAIGIWYTPFMLSRMPEEVYGIIPLTTSFLQYMLLLMTALSASIGRFVTADLSRGDVAAANATFNGFFFGGLKLVSVISVAIVVFCIILPIRVPSAYITETRFLAAAVFGSSLLYGFSNVFDTAIWATSRFELRNMLDITTAVLRNALVVVLFLLTEPSLWQVAVAVTVTAIFHASALFVVWKKLTPELRIDAKAMTAESRNVLFTTGGWVLVMNLGTALLLSSDLIVINRLFDTAQGAKYAVVLLWSTVLRGVFGSLNASLMPSLVAMEARQDNDYLLALSSKTIRVSGALCAHGAGLLAGLSLPILQIWLHKPWVSEVAPIAWIVMFPLCFEISFAPLLPAILTARPKVKLQALLSISCGLLSVVLAIVLAKYANLGMYGVAMGAAAGSLLRYAILNPLQAASAFDEVPWYFYIRQGVPTALRFVGTAITAYAASIYLTPSSLLSLAGCALAVTVVTLPINMAFLPRQDHVLFLKLLRMSDKPAT
jgi:membrane protein EpsK